MSVITVAYYALTAFLLGLVVWSFIREKYSRDRLVLYLLVMIPLVLRLLRVK